MKLSVVSTLYASAPYIEEFYTRITACLAELGFDYEIIFVNDGSPDESLAICRQLLPRAPRLKVIDLSRNFGHHKAIMTGLAHSDGDWVFLIDIDLEEAPEWLADFWSLARERPDADVVYGVQAQRRGGSFERWSGEIFYRVLNFFSSVKVPANLTTCRLMTRRYVDSLLEYREQELFLAGIWAAAGYTQLPVTVAKGQTSPSTYNLIRKLNLMVNALTAFSSRPLLWVFYLGCLVSAMSLGGIGFILIRKLLYNSTVLGWASLIASIWLMAGMIMLCLGIIGIYLAKVFNEVKPRPYSIVRQIYVSAAERIGSEP